MNSERIVNSELLVVEDACMVSGRVRRAHLGIFILLIDGAHGAPYTSPDEVKRNPGKPGLHCVSSRLRARFLTIPVQQLFSCFLFKLAHG